MFNELHNAAEPITISYSQYQKYKFCPWKYFIEKISGKGISDKSIFLYFGSAFHSAIQKKMLDLNIPVAEVEKNFRTDFYLAMHKDNFVHSKDEYALLCSQASDIFNSIPFEEIQKDWEVVHVEYVFQEEILPKIQFNGIIDFVLKHKKTHQYILGDWKTATKPWNEYKLNDKKFIAQLQFYKFFWSKKFGIPLDRIDTEYWVVCREGDEKLIRVKVDFEDLELKLNVGDLKYAINQIHFKKKFEKIKFSNSFNCKYCVYNHKDEYCNEEIFQPI